METKEEQEERKMEKRGNEEMEKRRNSKERK